MAYGILAIAGLLGAIGYFMLFVNYGKHYGKHGIETLLDAPAVRVVEKIEPANQPVDGQEISGK